jgi:hypothetical protein
MTGGSKYTYNPRYPVHYRVSTYLGRYVVQSTVRGSLTLGLTGWPGGFDWGENVLVLNPGVKLMNLLAAWVRSDCGFS